MLGYQADDHVEAGLRERAVREERRRHARLLALPRGSASLHAPTQRGDRASAHLEGVGLAALDDAPHAVVHDLEVAIAGGDRGLALDDEVERVPLVGLQVLRRLEPERGERTQHLLV